MDFNRAYEALMTFVADEELSMTVEEFAEIGVDAIALGTAIKRRLLDQFDRRNLETDVVSATATPLTSHVKPTSTRERMVKAMDRAKELLPASGEACLRIYDRLMAGERGRELAAGLAFRDGKKPTANGARQLLVNLYASGRITEEDLRDDGNE